MNKKDFDNVSTHPLQSWEWGEFRKKAGNELVRFYFGQITVHQLGPFPFKIGAFIKGPAPTQKILDELKAYAVKENLIFIKLEPNAVKDKSQQVKLLEKNGAVHGKTLFTPSTFWIDLTKSEEDLLKSFSSKTRYNIKIAQRNGVAVVEDNSDKAFDKYLELTRETVNRQGFYAHTEKYHRLMWKELRDEMISSKEKPIAHLLTAKYKGEIITTWILFVWKDFLYYPYGASTEKYKNVMANNLIMWEAIKFGKKIGLKTFDLWGREEGKGFTRFKEGYNPKVVEFLGSWDLITSPFYWPYRLAEKIRWLTLRLKSKFVKPAF
ncbi:peptidoglycan bridge formation glycyltransferase FemA/FemB family protein [Candidatus Woesebacteria bacterium]|nr:peptidoglycan bridge formation glycyltransferase FemA/FemB family protein [Candidatus Woesebacteria bacterium]